ncbi:MAG: glucosaminidase domain-containing protein [Bacteroidota bacterium]
MKLFTLIISLFSLPCLAQKGSVISEYISVYQQFAIAEQIRTGIPASITMAQAIHESGAGQGELALKSNNHFGIKCKNTWSGERVFHDDDSAGECFRAYISVAESFRDHSDFLVTGKRYGFLFKLSPTDYSGWAIGLKQAGYATNPKYPQILKRIIEENNLEILTETALQLHEKGNENIWLASSKTNTPAITNAPTRIIDSEDLSENNKVEKETVVSSQQVAASQQAIVKINKCKAVFVTAGTNLRKIAVQYNVDFNDLLRFNDLKLTEKLASNQVIFLQEKKKKGAGKFHIVQKGETSWLISQQEGIQLEKLLEYNHLGKNSKLKTGQSLNLKSKASR